MACGERKSLDFKGEVLISAVKSLLSGDFEPCGGGCNQRHNSGVFSEVLLQALWLGRAVVNGTRTLQVCPEIPRGILTHILNFPCSFTSPHHSSVLRAPCPPCSSALSKGSDPCSAAAGLAAVTTAVLGENGTWWGGAASFGDLTWAPLFFPLGIQLCWVSGNPAVCRDGCVIQRGAEQAEELLVPVAQLCQHPGVVLVLG